MFNILILIFVIFFAFYTLKKIIDYAGIVIIFTAFCYYGYFAYTEILSSVKTLQL